MRELARGNDGVVFEQREARAGVVLRRALKRLHDGVASAHRARVLEVVARLRGAPHRNLVALGEVVERDGGTWLSMPFVEGEDLVRFVRGEARDEGERAHLPLAFGQALQPLGRSAFTAPSIDGIARLRGAFVQLAQGVAHLHALGVVHRDLRPENVRVMASGRVVILDLGVNAWVGEPYDPSRAVGPVAYLAPELGVLDGAVDAAQDWYSVGVMLFEALTGTHPFEGSGDDVLVRKRSIAAPRVRFVAGDVPEALDALCEALLRRDPRARAGAREVMAALDLTPGPPLPNWERG